MRMFIHLKSKRESLSPLSIIVKKFFPQLAALASLSTMLVQIIGMTEKIQPISIPTQASQGSLGLTPRRNLLSPIF